MCWYNLLGSRQTIYLYHCLAMDILKKDIQTVNKKHKIDLGHRQQRCIEFIRKMMAITLTPSTGWIYVLRCSSNVLWTHSYFFQNLHKIFKDIQYAWLTIFSSYVDALQKLQNLKQITNFIGSQNISTKHFSIRNNRPSAASNKIFSINAWRMTCFLNMSQEKNIGIWQLEMKGLK